MPQVAQTHRILCCLLTAALVGVVVGLPFICLAAQTNPDIVRLMESEEVGDGKVGAFESDYSEVLALCHDIDDLAPLAYSHRVADGLVQTDSALSESRLQRGPPA
jgi:hypothetical protein